MLLWWCYRVKESSRGKEMSSGEVCTLSLFKYTQHPFTAAIDARGESDFAAP